MINQCTTEIHDLHQFFQDWFSGAIAQTTANFDRVTSALAPSFGLISPDGSLAEYALVINWLHNGYGTRPGFRLWTEDVVLRYEAGDLALVTYREWQQLDGQSSVRISSAFFGRRDSGPHGVEWLHVHETWLARPV
jgi:hypothetical protein